MCNESAYEGRITQLDLMIKFSTVRADRVTMSSRKLLLTICVAAVLMRMVVFLFPFVNIDENEFAVAGRIILDGGLPYRDFLIYQPPVIYYLYALAFAVFHTNSIWAAHIVVIGVVVASCIALYLTGRRLGGESTGLWAAGCYAIFSATFLPSEILGATCEVVLVLPVVCALWCAVAAIDSARNAIWLNFMAGVFLGIAFLTKYPAVLYLVPFLLFTKRTGFKGRVVNAAAIVCGWLATVGACALLLWWAGVWPETAATFVYILLYAKGPPQNDAIYVTLKFIARTALMAATGWLLWWNAACAVRRIFSLPFVRGGRGGVEPCLPQPLLPPQSFGGRGTKEGRSPWLLIAGCLAVGLVTVVIGGRIYFHYYYFVLPFLALLAGGSLAGLFGQAWWHRRRLVRVGWVAWTLLWVAIVFAYSFRVHALSGHLRGSDWAAAAQYLRESARPGETLFVWGYCPQMYTLSGLRPATRFVTSDYLTGRTPKSAGLEYDPRASMQPSSWEKFLNDFRNPPGVVVYDTSDAVFPGAWDMLEHDFGRRMPDYIVDTAPSNYRRYGRYRIEKFPFLHSAIGRSYTLVASMNGYDIYRHDN